MVKAMFSKFIAKFVLVFLCVAIVFFTLIPPSLAEKTVDMQELKDLKIALGTYEDGLYKIASSFLMSFLHNYPESSHRTRVFFLLGNCLTKSGQPHKALKVYKSALREIPDLKPADTVRFNYLIYKIYAKINKQKAIERLKYIVSFSGKRKVKTDSAFRAFFTLSKIYFEADKFDKSEVVLTKLLTLSPPSPWKEKALIQKGGLLIKQKKYRETIRILSPFVRNTDLSENDYSNEIFHLWAIANLKSGKYCKAQKSYKKLLEKTVDTPCFEKIIKGYIISFYRCYADENVRSDMFHSLQQKFHKRPSILFQIYSIEGVLYFQDKKYDKSQAILIKALKRFPDHPQVPRLLFLLDQSFKKMKDSRQWEVLLNEIEKNTKFLPESRIVSDFLLGNIYFSQNKYKTALPFYFNVINHKKYREKALEKIVFSYYYLKKFKEAKTNLDIYLLENPLASEIPSVLFLEGDLYLREKQTENALKVFYKIINDPKIKKKGVNASWVQKASLEMGKIFFQRKDTKKAKQYFLSVLRHPTFELENEKQAVFYLGLISERERQIDLSESYFQISSTSKEASIRIESLFRLGLLYFSTDYFKEASQQFEIILREFPKKKRWRDLSLLQLAKITIKSKHPEKADDYLKKIIETTEDKDIKSKAYQLHLKLHGAK